MYTHNERVEKVDVAEEMSKSFLDYSMSVIISRALPDARDGLKPSQRRILFAMHELGVYPKHKHMKCAKICGDTSGNYHPHGERRFIRRWCTWRSLGPCARRSIDAQGNFGSVEGDPPAAMRYTEARLNTSARRSWMIWKRIRSISCRTTMSALTEPIVFPAAFPNLLINGGTGIAVGMATNIPPHNLGEIHRRLCALIDDPGHHHRGLDAAHQRTGLSRRAA